ncbi:hypothetical protein [Tenacibaculum finnmarkense]|uniref:hypothetical protein n=1 Tax=Tenacibaculum finnmarkense TaxID=2781243 RepID=UPI001EFA6547|nr:hypothetical protein [Tenacibaculum finnmarkense]MCG8237379.1 hypothetical protein [Tenacibaculum finnmarkense genomovar ulcerans]MCG8831503.1 hypothetical protein [Tenacibaculum finnmarkense]
MNKLFILIFIAFGLQTDWLNETKETIVEIDKNAVLIDTKVIDEKDGKSTITEYKAGEKKKIKVEFVHTKLMDIEMSFYEKNGFVIGEIINGKDVLLYKRKRLENEPYATLIDSKTYFKNRTEGINLIRKINIYEADKIEDVRKKLNELEFETKNLNGEDYIRMKEKLDRITKIEK